jgi:hypothetical protein
MKNIDFLPDAYRKRDTLRRARWWWGAVVAIFGVAIGSAAFAQSLLKQTVQRELALVEPQYLAAQLRVQEMTNLQAQIAAASRAARLATWLEHPWPRSQVLAEIVHPLPSGVYLTEIHVTEETVEKQTKQVAGPRRRPKQEDEGPQLTGAEADLERLRVEANERRTVVRVAGATADVAAVHGYVSEVGKSSLFSDVLLESHETLIDEKQRSQTTFSLRLILQPSYGQSDEAIGSAGAQGSLAGIGANRAAPGGNRP